MAEGLVAEIFRRCSRCGADKLAAPENFSFIKVRNSFHAWCKPCCAEDRRRDRLARPEHYAAIDKACRERDRDKTRARNRNQYRKHYDKRIAELRARSRGKRDLHNANRRAKRITDLAWAEAQRAGERARRHANIDRYSEYARKAWANASPHRRLRNHFTSAICHSLKGNGKGGRSWEALLGYDTPTLQRHIERQFQTGMTWDNYGQWHVDHIVPVRAFRFNHVADADFAACWALTNLRPLWKRQNLSKSGKRLHLL